MAENNLANMPKRFSLLRINIQVSKIEWCTSNKRSILDLDVMFNTPCVFQLKTYILLMSQGTESTIPCIPVSGQFDFILH